MAQSVKSLPQKHKDSSLNPDPYEKASTTVHICNPRTETEVDRSQRSLAQQYTSVTPAPRRQR